ncbi:hypothetical protein D3C80_1622820 [compost metagenome]
MLDALLAVHWQVDAVALLQILDLDAHQGRVFDYPDGGIANDRAVMTKIQLARLGDLKIMWPIDAQHPLYGLRRGVENG